MERACVSFHLITGCYDKYNTSGFCIQSCVIVSVSFNTTVKKRAQCQWYRMVFASMRAMHLFLRARAVINFLIRAASTLEIANGEQRVLRKYPASWNLSLLKRCFAPINLTDTFKTGQQLQS